MYYLEKNDFYYHHFTTTDFENIEEIIWIELMIPSLENDDGKFVPIQSVTKIQIYLFLKYVFFAYISGTTWTTKSYLHLFTSLSEELSDGKITPGLAENYQNWLK